MRDEDVLGAFREDPLPPSGVDVGRAVRVGRRRQRMRAAGAAGAAVLVLAVGGVAGQAFLGVHIPWQLGAVLWATGEPPPPCPSPSPTAEPAVPQDGTAPAEFGVLRHWIGVGDLTRQQGRPSDLHVENHTTARYWQRVTLYDRAEQTLVEVVVFAKGGKPRFGPPGRSGRPVDMAGAEPAGQVGGAAAAWVPGRQGLFQYDVARLGWQWADGGWAFVAVGDITDEQGGQPTPERLAALRARALEVAAALRIGRGAAVTAPFTVPGVPRCSRLVLTSLHRGVHTNGTPFSRMALMFDRVDGTDPYRSGPGVRTVVTADSVATPADRPGSAGERIDGRPAVVNEGFLVLYGVDGFALEVEATLNREELIAYGRSIAVVPGAHGDESKWTERPIR